MTDRPWMRPRAAGRVGPELRRRLRYQRWLSLVAEDWNFRSPFLGPALRRRIERKMRVYP